MQKEDLVQLYNHLNTIAKPLLFGDVPDLGCRWRLLSGDVNKPTSGIVYRTSSDKYGYFYKLVMLIEGANPEELRGEFTHAADVEGFHEGKPWVPNQITGRLLDQGRFDDVDWDVVYQEGRILKAIANRDFINIRFRSSLSNGVLYEVSTAAPDGKYSGYNSKCVQGECVFGGYMIEPYIKDGVQRGCLLSYLHNTDLKGYIPMAMISMVIPSAISNFLLSFGRCVQTRMANQQRKLPSKK